MHPVTIVLLVILVILIGLLVGLYFFGKKTQKKQEEQQAQIEASKQTVSMLVIDKKRMPLKESGLPQMVIDQTPKLLRRSKMPIVKAKVGPKISILIEMCIRDRIHTSLCTSSINSIAPSTLGARVTSFTIFPEYSFSSRKNPASGLRI